MGEGLIPIIGDWDGDGNDNIGVYRPSTEEFFFESIPADNFRDQQAKQDIISRGRSDSRFGNPIPGTFGKNLDWHPEWELRWVDFNFSWDKIVRIYHATKKTDSSIGYTIFWDPDIGNWTSWERAYSKDRQAKKDMIDFSKTDFRFGNYIPGTFGKDLDYFPEWEVRWMDFSFYGNRIVKIWHATKKIDPSIRYTIFSDPDTKTWTDWIKVR